MKKLKMIGVVLGLLAVLNMTGCATIMSGGPSKMNVTSNPPGAKVQIKGISNGQQIEEITPFEVVLKKNSDYRFNFEMEGYNSETVRVNKIDNGWVWGNVITPLVIVVGLSATAASAPPASASFYGNMGLAMAGLASVVLGLGGWGIDSISDNTWKHDKDHIDLTLTKVGSASSTAIPVGKN